MSSKLSASSDISAIVETLRNAPFYEGQIVRQGVSEPRGAKFLEPERPMHIHLRERLRATGIDKLYRHQATAFDLAEAGHNVVVTTGTSSGKTLCFNLPALNRMLHEPAGKALYLFPTKALAQDQLGKLNALAPTGVRAATYDGDTPKHQRSPIRNSSHIILTNPDMLHIGILPNHQSWTRFLRSLRFIVMDEMHTYSGVFGSHVALIMRRLLRLCENNGSKPQIIACSATIANGLDLFRALTGRDADLIDDDGSPSGKRYLLMWNPPETEEGLRRSPNTETSQLLGSLAVRNVRTLAFAKSRITAELILRYAREGLAAVNGDLAQKIESYRAGYTPAERREIERRLFSGELVGLSTTDAMELGVDVGTLDAVVMNGYPGSISSLRQQAGRAGRGTREGLGILVGRNDPLDQYYMRHPEILLGGRAESVRIHPSNPFILAQQLRCAAFERPLGPSELSHFPEQSLEILEMLEEAGLLIRRAGLWFYPTAESPAADVDIRGDGAGTYCIMSENGAMGSMEQWRAFSSAHPGAVYLHRAEQFLVSELDIRAKVIRVERAFVDYYTQSLAEMAVTSSAELGSRAVGRAELHFQALKVTTTVTCFKRKSLLNDSVLSVEELDLPPTTMDTVGLRLDLPSSLQESDWIDGVHALEHLLVALAPTIAQCEQRDLGSTYYSIWPETGLPCIFVFDAVPGGIGLSQALYESAEEWLARVAEQLENCPCKSGCPACIYSPRCQYANEGLDKAAAIYVLRSVISEIR